MWTCAWTAACVQATRKRLAILQVHTWKCKQPAAAAPSHAQRCPYCCPGGASAAGGTFHLSGEATAQFPANCSPFTLQLDQGSRCRVLFWQYTDDVPVSAAPVQGCIWPARPCCSPSNSQQCRPLSAWHVATIARACLPAEQGPADMQPIVTECRSQEWYTSLVREHQKRR